MREVKINKLLKTIILELVDITTFKNSNKIGRPVTFSNKKYLDAIFYVLKEGIGWNYLKQYPIKGDTVRKKFYLWNKNGIFRFAWIILVNMYKEFKIDMSNLYIDASHIKNMLGTESTGSNYYDRFRKSTKLSIITDDIGVPVSIKIDKGNRHDIKFMLDNLSEIPFDISDCKFLIGDKGYISNKLAQILAHNYNIKLVVPKRKNKKNKLKNRGRKPKHYYKLKKRFIVEHCFSWFKHYGRLFRRKDKLKNNFCGFVFLAAANIVSNKIQTYIS